MVKTELLGLFERKLRTEIGLSIDNVAYDLKISKGNLSDAENGKRLLKEPLFLRFLECYNICFDFGPSFPNQIKNELDHLIKAFIYRNKEQEYLILEQINKKRTKYEHSLASLYLMLIDLFSTLRISPKEIDTDKKRVIKEIDKYLNFFSGDEKALIYFLEAYNQRKLKHDSVAAKLYREALAVFNGIQWPQLAGIIKSNYASLLFASTSFFDAYQTYEEANEIFLKHSNYIRALICCNNMANCLINLQIFDGAERLLDKVLLSEQSFANSPAISAANKSMLLLLTLKGDFQGAVDFSTHVSVGVDQTIGNLSLIPYCLLRLGKKDECLKKIEYLSSFHPTSDDVALFRILKAILSDNLPEIENARLKMIQICCKQFNWAMLMVLYQLMIYYYKSANDLKRLVEVYEQQAMVLKHSLPLSASQQRSKKFAN